MLRLGANWRLLLDCDLSFQISAHEEVATRYPRRIASIPLLERAGRLTHDLAEAAAERTEAAEPHTKTDLRDGEVRRSEQILCPFNSALGDVRCRCSPVSGSEEAVKVKFGERRHRREVLQSERLGKVSIGVISRSAQLDQCMNRNFRCLHGQRIDRRNSRTGSVREPALNRRTCGEFSGSQGGSRTGPPPPAQPHLRGPGQETTARHPSPGRYVGGPALQRKLTQRRSLPSTVDVTEAIQGPCRM